MQPEKRRIQQGKGSVGQRRGNSRARALELKQKEGRRGRKVERCGSDSGKRGKY